MAGGHAWLGSGMCVTEEGGCACLGGRRPWPGRGVHDWIMHAPILLASGRYASYWNAGMLYFHAKKKFFIFKYV